MALVTTKAVQQTGEAADEIKMWSLLMMRHHKQVAAAGAAAVGDRS